jgi:hypothetical protein
MDSSEVTYLCLLYKIPIIIIIHATKQVVAALAR